MRRWLVTYRAESEVYHEFADGKVRAVDESGRAFGTTYSSVEAFLARVLSASERHPGEVVQTLLGES